MLSFGAGVISLVVVCLVVFFLGNWSLVFNYSGLIGLVAVLISALLSGVFISGDRARANWNNEDSEDRGIRQAWATKTFLFGVPNLIGAIMYQVLK